LVWRSTGWSLGAAGAVCAVLGVVAASCARRATGIECGVGTTSVNGGESCYCTAWNVEEGNIGGGCNPSVAPNAICCASPDWPAIGETSACMCVAAFTCMTGTYADGGTGCSCEGTQQALTQAFADGSAVGACPVPATGNVCCLSNGGTYEGACSCVASGTDDGMGNTPAACAGGFTQVSSCPPTCGQPGYFGDLPRQVDSCASGVIGATGTLTQ
jgi:hypothetical protein